MSCPTERPDPPPIAEDLDPAPASIAASESIAARIAEHVTSEMLSDADYISIARQVYAQFRNETDPAGRTIEWDEAPPVFQIAWVNAVKLAHTKTAEIEYRTLFEKSKDGPVIIPRPAPAKRHRRK